jgi:hypothetical protein
MKRRILALSAALAAAALTTVAGPARAEYCRTKACDNFLGYDDVWQSEPDPPCDQAPNGCRYDGQPLYWPHSCLSFSVQQDGSPKQSIDYETAHGVIEQAFITWMSADCGDGATPALRVDDFSPASCNHPEYNTDQGNANVFMFRDGDWPHSSAEDTLALTTITYNRENAQIFDADVEINSYLARFTVTDDASASRDDLLAVLTHETGHFLGLSHDDNEQATMYASYDRRTPFLQRDLYTTDIAGICEIYPPGERISEDECIPRHGLLRTCAVKKSSGCAIGSERTNAVGALGLLAVLGVGLTLRRRSKR